MLYKQELSYTVDNQYIEDVYVLLSEICDYIEGNKIDKEHCRELDKKIETLKMLFQIIGILFTKSIQVIL